MLALYKRYYGGKDRKMKKIIILSLGLFWLLLSVAAYGVDTDASNVYWKWTTGGLWMNTDEWGWSGISPEWGVPGWVSGNPNNTTGSTDPNWNQGRAVIDGGSAVVTPASRPDGVVERVYLGGGGGAGLDISGDITMKYLWIGKWLSTDNGTVNQTAGNVVIQNKAYLGDSGSAIYNLSGGSLTFVNDKIYIGNNSGASCVFNQTGGSVTFINSGPSYLGNGAGSLGTYNLSSGTFSFNRPSSFWVGNDGIGVFNQTGGSAFIKLLRIGSSDSNSIYTISDGTFSASLVKCYYGVFKIIGTGPDSIITNSFIVDNGGKLKLELGASGCTMIDVNGTKANTYYGVSLRDATIDVSTASNYAGTIGSHYDVIWSATTIDTYRLKIRDDSSTHDFKYVVVDGAANGYSGGKVLRLIETTGHCGDATHSYPQGDIDQNCRVDFDDFVIIAENWAYDGAPFSGN
jgi:hypothetical protein